MMEPYQAPSLSGHSAQGAWCIIRVCGSEAGKGLLRCPLTPQEGPALPWLLVMSASPLRHEIVLVPVPEGLSPADSGSIIASTLCLSSALSGAQC